MGWIDEKRLPNGLLRPLTPRQQDVVRLVALDRTRAEIAAELRISEDRVKQIVSRVASLLPNPHGLRPTRLVQVFGVAEEFNRQGRM